MPFDAALLSERVLVAPDGTAQRLGELWADRPHVLLFLRHFG